MRAVWARLVEGCWWRKYWVLRRFSYFLNVIKLYGLFYFVQFMFAFCRSCTAQPGSAGHRLDGAARSGLGAAGRTAGTGCSMWGAASASPRAAAMVWIRETLCGMVMCAGGESASCARAWPRYNRIPPCTAKSEGFLQVGAAMAGMILPLHQRSGGRSAQPVGVTAESLSARSSTG